MKVNIKLILLIFIIIAVHNTAIAENPPKIINSLAEENNCNPLEDDPVVDKMLTFWWIDLKHITGSKNDFMFVCRKVGDSSVYRIILNIASSRNPWSDCPPRIDVSSVSYPSGLAILMPDNWAYPKADLSHWRTEDGEKGSINVKLTKPVIDTSLQVAGDLFYCHKGKWYTLFIH